MEFLAQCRYELHLPGQAQFSRRHPIEDWKNDRDSSGAASTAGAGNTKYRCKACGLEWREQVPKSG